VASINVSAGGVPKLRVQSGELGREGFDGDGHHDIKHHGGPDRAVCIYATEIIEALRAEGHPIDVGTAGENLTVSGLDWAKMVPGARVIVGAALVEVTGYTSPCRTIRRSFIDGHFARISQQTNPGWSRVYARTLRDGRVEVGDAVDIIER
jgi:MOSC domain-containing protein YiiM